MTTQTRELEPFGETLSPEGRVPHYQQVKGPSAASSQSPGIPNQRLRLLLGDFLAETLPGAFLSVEPPP